MRIYMRMLYMSLLLLSLFGCGRYDPFYEDREYFRQNAKIGMSEEDIRKQLGSPMREHTKEDAPDDYYVKGWSFKKRDISHKVLIYQKGEPICYVWINSSGKVEDVFVGGS